MFVLDEFDGMDVKYHKKCEKNRKIVSLKNILGGVCEKNKKSGGVNDFEKSLENQGIFVKKHKYPQGSGEKIV